MIVLHPAFFKHSSAILLLEDAFATPDASPLASPRTADGLGKWDVTQPDAPFAVASGSLEMLLTPAASGLRDNTLTSQADFTDAVGLAVKLSCEIASTSQATVVHLVNGTTRRTGILLNGTNLRLAYNVNDISVSDGLALGTLTTSAHDIALVYLSSSLAGLFMKISDEWCLLGVCALQGSQTLNALEIATRRNDATNKIGRIVIAYLTGTWAQANGLATEYKAGTVTAGTTFVHQPDFVAYVDVGTISGAAKEFRFRVQDASNYWVVTCDSTSTDLDEVVAGVPTQRGTAAALSSNARLQIRADGTNIDVWNNTSTLMTYASASNFQAEMAGSIENGSMADLLAFPVQVSGTKAQILEAL